MVVVQDQRTGVSSQARLTRNNGRQDLPTRDLFDRSNPGPWLSKLHLVTQYDGIVVSKLDRLSRGRGWGIRAWAVENRKKLIVVNPELSWPPGKGDAVTPLAGDGSGTGARC